jgi:hypothetical protein
MKKLIALIIVFIISVQPVFAQSSLEEATDSGQATSSAEATPSGLVQKLVEKPSDLTETEGETKGKLRQYLEEQELGPLNFTNFIRHAIRQAVSRGVPANTIVLVLLFPVVAAIIAASRHLLGLRGFGIFIPAVLSVAFVATGLGSGVLIFLVILVVATIGRVILKRLKLQYLPRMALLLWFVSLGVFGLLYVSPLLGLETITKLNIFPILILVLLTESFIEVQIGKNKKEATELTAETMVLAVISSLFLSLDLVQKFAILFPEALVLMVALFDVFVGRYKGLRFLEYLKFKDISK